MTRAELYLRDLNYRANKDWALTRTQTKTTFKDKKTGAEICVDRITGQIAADFDWYGSLGIGGEEHSSPMAVGLISFFAHEIRNEFNVIHSDSEWGGLLNPGDCLNFNIVNRKKPYDILFLGVGSVLEVAKKPLCRLTAQDLKLLARLDKAVLSIQDELTIAYGRYVYGDEIVSLVRLLPDFETKGFYEKNRLQG